MNLLFVLPVLLFLILSCTDSINNQKEPLAKVYNSYLYKEDITGIFPANISTADSVKLARNYVDKWIRNQLFLRLAEINLPEEDKDLNKQIADYRASLLIFKYQQYLLNQKLDSLISVKEIEDYYENHGNNFILDKPLITGILVKVPVNAPDQGRLLPLFRSGNNIDQIENYANQHGGSYALFSDEWLYLDEVMSMLPPQSAGATLNISNTDHLAAKDNDHYYFLGIYELRPARSQMPLALAVDNIRTIILNKRKIQLLNELENNVLAEGLNKNAYQYY